MIHVNRIYHDLGTPAAANCSRPGAGRTVNRLAGLSGESTHPPARPPLALLRRFIAWLVTPLVGSLDDHPADCHCAGCADEGFHSGPIRFGPAKIEFFDGPHCPDCGRGLIECRCLAGE